VDLNGKKVLEVGCGHGGGASYIKRYLGPASYPGLDLNPTGVGFCQKGTRSRAWILCRVTPRTYRFQTGPSTRRSMSNPRITTLTRPNSSTRWPVCCAREGISFTPTASPLPVSRLGSHAGQRPAAQALRSRYQC
jgi:hypothetical protein